MRGNPLFLLVCLVLLLCTALPLYAQDAAPLTAAEAQSVLGQYTAAWAAGDLDAFGRLLHEGWELKKQMASKISNGSLDAIYQAARQAGALGGKITGAGGGGFLLLFCPHSAQRQVRQALAPLPELPVSVEMDGSQVIFNYRR